MKMRHTEQTEEILLQLPPLTAEKVSDAIQRALKSMGHTVRVRHLNDEGEELLTFEEVFPDAHPGMILRGCRGRDDMTQTELADKLGIAQTRVSEMESGKRPISVKMAKQFAEIFGTSYKAFL
jgi:DNA-binding XRE family transcriptional regulator